MRTMINSTNERNFLWTLAKVYSMDALGKPDKALHSETFAILIFQQKKNAID